MLFKNSIFLYFKDIYTNKKYSTVFYEEMYHFRRCKKPFDVPANLNKIIQFFKFKEEYYLYFNIPKVFFINNFIIDIVLDDDLVKILNLKSNTFSYSYDNKYYEDKLILFKDISVKLNLDESKIMNNLMESNLTDIHQVNIRPTFIQYRIQENFMNQNDNITSFQNDIFINLRKLVKNGKDIMDYLLDYKIEIINNGIFKSKKFFKNKKLILAICCSIFVDYNLPERFMKDYF